MEITVLIADDHEIVRDGLRLVLDDQDDISVVADAANGREAVTKAHELKPSVVVMDVAMPELNGIDAAEQVLQLSPDTHVVILSMYATSEHVFRALRAGALGYVLKEAAGKELVKAVRAVANGHRYLSERVADVVFEDYMVHRESSRDVSPLDRLSAREREVLQLVVEGASSADIAKKLYLSPKTVETYRSRIMVKLEVGDLPTLVKFAIQHGITSV